MGLASALLVPMAVLADWGPDGVRVSPLAGQQQYASIVPDGVGGWYVSWIDNADYDLYVQRFDAEGSVAPGWPAAGFPVCTAPGEVNDYSMVADGHGGILIVWLDSRDGYVTEYDVYLQRVVAAGAIAPGWPINGLPVCTAVGNQWSQHVALDGAGGVVMVWADNRNQATQSVDVYAARVLLDGSFDSRWPTNGRLIVTGPTYQQPSEVISDGAGGAIMVWAHSPPFESYAIRLGPDGVVAPGWQPTGNLIAAPGRAAWVISDGQGGLYAALVDGRSTPPGQSEDAYLDLYAQRVQGDGTRAPGWPLDGKPIVVVDRDQHLAAIAPDGQGGAYLAWRDDRNHFDGQGSATDVYAQRIMPNGDPAFGWPVNGLRACALPNFQLWPRIAVDYLGNLVIAFENLGDSRIWVQQVTPMGTFVNTAEPSGHSVSTGPVLDQEQPTLAADQLGNVLAAWTNTVTANSDHIYAKRVVTNLPTATTVALVRAQADPDQVRLEWYATGDPVRVTRVYRSEDGVSWQEVGIPVVTGTGHITYEDGSVTPGTHYAYRLGYAAADEETFTAMTWVNVPAAFHFALAGAQPNPVRDAITVAFSLASSAPAEIELFDLAGRRVSGQVLSSPRPGIQSLRFVDARSLDAGVYWLRLRQGADHARSRVVVMR